MTEGLSSTLSNAKCKVGNNAPKLTTFSLYYLKSKWI